ncbi:MAG: hypothetical protein ACP5RC_06585 [Halothiobacillaceae bacterium]
MKPGMLLIPTLETIERGLFGGADPVEESLIDSFGAQESAELVCMGEAVRAMIARRAASAATADDGAPATPRPGDVWWLRLDEPAEQAVGMLLQSVEPTVVSGWLVASESAYATDRDWVVQEDEVQTALDPRVGMVQLWHPVTVARDRLGERAARLADEVLDHLQRVAEAPSMAADVHPSPGRVGLVKTEGVLWVCGTPLGDSDPRRKYQSLYRRLAATLRMASSMDTPLASPPHAGFGDQQATNVIDIARGRKRANAWLNGDFWRGAGVAAALLLAVGIPYLRIQQQAGPDATTLASTVRGLAEQGPSADFKVHISASATMAQISALLQQGQMRISAGPDPSGAYIVTGPGTAATQRLLNGSSLVVTWSEKRR